MNKAKLKDQLKFWFTVHFAADVLSALPLMIAPYGFLRLVGWESVDPVTARLVAAALFGIGIESLIGRNASLESFKEMLNLKIIWSGAALLGFLVNLIQRSHGNPLALWIFCGIFLAFHILWIYFRIMVGRFYRGSGLPIK